MAAGLFVLFFGLYTFFDFREGGSGQSLSTTQLAAPGFYVETFGAAWFYGSIVLNVALAGLSAALVVLAIRRFRGHASGAACSVGAVTLLGFAVCGCPGFVMPVVGSLGATFFAASMPLMGLEFKVLSLLLLAATLVWTVRSSRTAEPRTASA